MLIACLNISWIYYTFVIHQQGNNFKAFAKDGNKHENKAKWGIFHNSYITIKLEFNIFYVIHCN